MGWRIHGFFIILRTCSFAATHLAWILALMSRCAYFQLWKSYDMFWLWIYVITTCAAPRLRYHNLILQCTFLWRKKLCGGERWRYALKQQDEKIEEEQDQSAKIANAFDLGVSLLRLRVSAAMLIGNIHLSLTVPRYEKSNLNVSPAAHVLDWAPFQYGIWLDLCLFWSMLLMLWCKQCRLCCQLGCCRYYLWCALVVLVGAVLMDAPMYFAFRRLDRTWCNLTLFPNSNNNATSILSTLAPMAGRVVKVE